MVLWNLLLHVLESHPRDSEINIAVDHFRPDINILSKFVTTMLLADTHTAPQKEEIKKFYIVVAQETEWTARAAHAYNHHCIDFLISPSETSGPFY